MRYISGESVKIGDHVLIENGKTKATVKHILDNAEQYSEWNLTEPCLMLEAKPFGLVSWQVQDNMVFVGRAQEYEQIDNTSIDIIKLKKITNLIFDHIIEDLSITNVEIDKALYWTLNQEEASDLDETPIVKEIGNLSDDLEFLQHISDKESAPSIMFTHLAPLLKYIGTKVGQ